MPERSSSTFPAVASPFPSDEHIDSVDVWSLPTRLRWPIMRVLARAFVEQLELGRYVRSLLATGRWSVIRLVPCRDDQGRLVAHRFDVFGVRAADREPSARGTALRSRAG